MLTSVIGFFAGILSGMGIGGGMVLIPALCIFAGVSQKEAQAINLFYFIPTAITALFVHIKNKNVKFYEALPLILGGVPFCFLGARLALYLSGKTLSRLFAVFIFCFGVSDVLKSAKKILEERKKSAK